MYLGQIYKALPALTTHICRSVYKTGRLDFRKFRIHFKSMLICF